MVVGHVRVCVLCVQGPWVLCVLVVVVVVGGGGHVGAGGLALTCAGARVG